MAGLVGYDSSDDDEDAQIETQPQAPQEPPEITQDENELRKANLSDDSHTKSNTNLNGPILGPVIPPEAALMGPSLPTAGDDARFDLAASTADGSAPSSPYAANQSLLRDLTLPPVPDLSIPASPPGTPPPSLVTLNKRFDNFLDLKRKQGAHFNDRLSQNSNAKNPALMDKLLGFAGIESSFEGKAGKSDPAAQYATTLSTDIWDPSAFPEWAFKGRLRQSQETLQKERTRAVGEPVEFVPASGSGTLSKPGSQAGTPSGGLGKRKTRFNT